MRHANYALKPATIGNAKPREKAYALTDGGGLQIEILPSGTRSATARPRSTWRANRH